MKHFKLNTLLLAVAVGFAMSIAAQPAEAPDQTPPPMEDNIPEVPPEDYVPQIPDEVIESVLDSGTNSLIEDMLPDEDGAPREPDSFVREGTTPPRFVAPMRSGVTNATTDDSGFNLDQTLANATPPDQVVKEGERGLRLNFRAAPLELVLNYLSDAAGFIIVPETDVRGKVDVWSNQPVTKDEAVQLLNKVLAQEGYAVLRDGRTLTIVTQAEAKKRDIPVKTGYEPANIPKDQQVVTQIIPVRFINAVQLARDLQPLMPSQTTMTANEGGNALVITDTQTNIRRMAEIIKALDTTVSSLSSVKVFPLRYADAKTVADMIKEVFASSDASSNRGGGGGRGQFRFGGGGGGEAGTSATGRPGASKVVATADERSNSLVVSAPDDLMPTIEQLVESVDTNVEDVTEIRVFRLQHADPRETSELLTSLFPDPTSAQNNQGGGGFRGFFRGRGGDDNSTANAQSDRMKKQSKVIAVPDNRTRSVVVTAARDTMEQIGKMIEQLDSDPARKQKVFVYEVQNTDPATVQQTLEDLFNGGQGSSSSRARTATGQAGSQLNTRAQQQNQNNGNRNTGFGGNTGGGGNRSFGN